MRDAGERLPRGEGGALKFWFVQVQHGGDVHENVRLSRSDAKRWAVDRLRTLGEPVGGIDWTDTEESSRAEIGLGASILITFREPPAD